ncbi:MAG: hypothetical protein RDV41_08080, partial [Planctomycetota bacterium]|nr:hypothetical protein [Planctomycetota bacterium]
DVVPNIHLLTVEAPDVARMMKPGQFVIVRAENDGERIPLSVSDWSVPDGTLTIGTLSDYIGALYAETYVDGAFGVYGVNASTGTNLQYGVYGTSTGDTGTGTKFGVYAKAMGTAGVNYGLYALATGGTVNWAGYFDNAALGLTAGNYINWGATPGAGGYGFYDNSGTIQFKNSSGSWAAIAPATGGNYLAKNAQDASTASINGIMYGLSNTNAGLTTSCLRAHSTGGAGISGQSRAGGADLPPNVPVGVHGMTDTDYGYGVVGESLSGGAGGTTQRGVYGLANAAPVAGSNYHGVEGVVSAVATANRAVGVLGVDGGPTLPNGFWGVLGITDAEGGYGAGGVNRAGGSGGSLQRGLYGRTDGAPVGGCFYHGLEGVATQNTTAGRGAGVVGLNGTPTLVAGFFGVFGATDAASGVGIYGKASAPAATGIVAENTSGTGLALRVTNANMTSTGDLSMFQIGTAAGGVNFIKCQENGPIERFIVGALGDVWSSSGYFSAPANYTVRVDSDNNGSNMFNVQNSAAASVFKVDEAGRVGASSIVRSTGGFVRGGVPIHQVWTTTGAVTVPNGKVWLVEHALIIKGGTAGEVNLDLDLDGTGGGGPVINLLKLSTQDSMASIDGFFYAPGMGATNGWDFVVSGTMTAGDSVVIVGLELDLAQAPSPTATDYKFMQASAAPLDFDVPNGSVLLLTWAKRTGGFGTITINQAGGSWAPVNASSAMSQIGTEFGISVKDNGVANEVNITPSGGTATFWFGVLLPANP